MIRTPMTMPAAQKDETLQLVNDVFTAHESAAEGAIVCRLVEEIRASSNHIPELELIMADEAGQAIAYAMFSRFHLNGQYADELLLLTPVAVKTELQRQHISKELLEYGFDRAAKMGFSAVIVEGGPHNYRARGFVTAADHDILPGKTVHLPAIECLMVKELLPGALGRIRGTVEYEYPVLLEE